MEVLMNVYLRYSFNSWRKWLYILRKWTAKGVYGQQEVTDEQDWERAYRQVCGQRGRNVTVAQAISPINGLVFHSAFHGGMTGQGFNDLLTQARLNLDPNEHVIFIYDGAPAHNNPAIPGPNSELKKLPPYSPFLNVVEQAISVLKAAIKAVSYTHLTLPTKA